MVLFFDLLTQKESGAFPGIIVVVHRPADRTALCVPDPVLPYTGSKDRVFDIEQEYTAGAGGVENTFR